MGNKDFGGVIRIRTSRGVSFSGRGTMNMNTSGVSVEPVTNQDGSLDRTSTPRHRGVDFNFADRGLDHDAMMKGERMDVTFIEEHTGVTHYFTDGFLAGDPVKNRLTGEVTGISLAAETYRKTEG